VGGYLSSKSQTKAADKASAAQTQSAEMGIEEQRRQFDAIQKLLSPYVNAGNSALGAQQNLLGLGGPAAQQAAIGAIEDSPQFAALTQQGEEVILANASATGGLRGGNVQAAMMQFRPQVLAQLINDRYAQLGGLAGLGQNAENAAAGVGNAGMQTGNNVTQLLGQQGAASAGAALLAGKAQSQFATDATSALTNFIGKKF